MSLSTLETEWIGEDGTVCTTMGGIDEAGRGCLAGPVYAACVVWDASQDAQGIRDSKKMRPSKREEMETYIQTHARAWGIGFASAAEVDTHNIRRATHLAMHRAVDQVVQTFPKLPMLLVDGNDFTPYHNTNGSHMYMAPPPLKYHTVLQGDNKYVCIAAASILAKTAHDRAIHALLEEDPSLEDRYGWSSNMTYGTAKHREGIARYGMTPHHRQSFQVTFAPSASAASR